MSQYQSRPGGHGSHARYGDGGRRAPYSAGAADRRRIASLDRERERYESAAGAFGEPEKGDRGPEFSGRVRGANPAAVDYRGTGPCCSWERFGPRAHFGDLASPDEVDPRESDAPDVGMA